jgi:hypothetical protein
MVLERSGRFRPIPEKGDYFTQKDRGRIISLSGKGETKLIKFLRRFVPFEARPSAALRGPRSSLRLLEIFPAAGFRTLGLIQCVI